VLVFHGYSSNKVFNGESMLASESMTTKRPKVMVYLDDEQLKADLEALAAFEGRSLSNLFNRLAKNAVEQAKSEGYIQ
jgi:hypothetical protein